MGAVNRFIIILRILFIPNTQNFKVLSVKNVVVLWEHLKRKCNAFHAQRTNYSQLPIAFNSNILYIVYTDHYNVIRPFSGFYFQSHR